MNIFKMAFSNMRKRKGATITFLIMTVLSAVMLTISLTLMSGLSDFYENKVNEIGAPHFNAAIYTPSFEASWEDSNNGIKEFIDNYEGVEKYSTQDALLGIGAWEFGNTELAFSLMLINEQQTYRDAIFKPQIINKAKTEYSNRITLPLSIKTYGVKTGDTIIYNMAGTQYEFRVNGFYEDALYGASTFSVSSVYIDENLFYTMGKDRNFTPHTSLQVRFDDSSITSDFVFEFSKMVNINPTEMYVGYYDTSAAAATMFTNMISMILIIFSVIILIIAFIIVGFAIKTSIAEEITTTGVLKGIGYSNRYLRGTQILQYLIISLVGSVVGAIVATACFGLLGNIITSTSGLLWVNTSPVLPMTLSVLIIVALTAGVAWLSTFQYKKITPLNALRPISSRAVKSKDGFPLTKGKLPTNMHLGIKRFFSTIGVNISLFIVTMMLVFVSLVLNVMNHNLNSDRTAMVEMVGMEMSDIYAQTTAKGNIDELAVFLDPATNENIDRIIRYGSRTAAIGNTLAAAETTEFDKLEINTIVKGRNPEKVGEAAVGAVTLSQIGKKLGDEFIMEVAGVSQKYKIVGIMQNIAKNGNNVAITYEAMRLHIPDFVHEMLYVYTKDGVDVPAYTDVIKQEFGDKVEVIDTSKSMDGILDSIAAPVGAIFIVMMIANILIVAFVLYLIIGTIIRRAKKEFGIMKALGFRTRDLIVQLLVSLLPSLIFGTALGILLGFTLANPLLTVMFGSMGLLETYFILPILSSVFVSLSVFAAGGIMTYLMALRLRKISPQKLIAE